MKQKAGSLKKYTKLINTQLDSSRKKGRTLKLVKLEMQREQLQWTPQKQDHKRLL